MGTLLMKAEGFTKVSYWCPPKISRPKQLESALQDVTNRMHVRFHTHEEEEDCPGFSSPGGTTHHCWEFMPDEA